MNLNDIIKQNQEESASDSEFDNDFDQVAHNETTSTAIPAIPERPKKHQETKDADQQARSESPKVPERPKKHHSASLSPPSSSATSSAPIVPAHPVKSGSSSPEETTIPVIPSRPKKHSSPESSQSITSTPAVHPAIPQRPTRRQTSNHETKHEDKHSPVADLGISESETKVLESFSPIEQAVGSNSDLIVNNNEAELISEKGQKADSVTRVEDLATAEIPESDNVNTEADVKETSETADTMEENALAKDESFMLEDKEDKPDQISKSSPDTGVPTKNGDMIEEFEEVSKEETNEPVKVVPSIPKRPNRPKQISTVSSSSIESAIDSPTDRLIEKTNETLKDLEEITKSASNSRSSTPSIPPRPMKAKPLVRQSTNDLRDEVLDLYGADSFKSSSRVPSSDKMKSKGPPPVPKKPSSKIAAFQEMLRKNQEMEQQEQQNRSVHRTSTISSNEDNTESTSERSKFKKNLNGMFALPGMALPGMFHPGQSQTGEAENEAKEEPTSADARKSRARGPRGKRLPQSAKEKVEIEDKRSVKIVNVWSLGEFETDGIYVACAETNDEKESTNEPAPDVEDEESKEIEEVKKAANIDTDSKVTEDEAHFQEETGSVETESLKLEKGIDEHFKDVDTTEVATDVDIADETTGKPPTEEVIVEPSEKDFEGTSLEIEETNTEESEAAEDTNEKTTFEEKLDELTETKDVNEEEGNVEVAQELDI